jgi:AraC-like ligand binding domain
MWASGAGSPQNRGKETAMTDITFNAFEAEALSQGFDEVVPREWASGQVVDEHTHPFGVRALVVQGEMWLTVGDATQHLRPGDTFALAHGMPHAERYGAEGATYWAARRHVPPTPAA